MKKRKPSDKSLQERYADTASKSNAGRPDPFAAAQAIGYSDQDLIAVPAEAVQLALGCGNPTALANLRPGDVVLDLGAGGGLDAFLAARKVGPQGRVIGIDATPEMVARARAFAARAGYANVEFLVGRMEQLPLPDRSVDVVISNCVINHAPDKAIVFREAFRVLRPAGRLFVSDLVTHGQPPAPDTPGLDIWRDWLAVASGRDDYLAALSAAGFANVAILSEVPYAGPAMHDRLAGTILNLSIRAER